MHTIRFLLVPMLLILFIGLSYSVLSLPQETAGLTKTVDAQMHKSGVSNPVTAVLMNFRAYDTLLEMAVLFVALLGAYSLNSSESYAKVFLKSTVLNTFAGILVPILILVCTYLLWVGAYAPGGAFQAGAVLGAIGILILLSGWKLYLSPRHHLVRVLVVASLSIFIFVAIWSMLVAGRLLEFPVAQASYFIFILEAVATISIGMTLFSLFFSIFSEPKGKS